MSTELLVYPDDGLIIFFFPISMKDLSIQKKNFTYISSQMYSMTKCGNSGIKAIYNYQNEDTRSHTRLYKGSKTERSNFPGIFPWHNKLSDYCHVLCQAKRHISGFGSEYIQYFEKYMATKSCWIMDT